MLVGRVIVVVIPTTFILFLAGTLKTFMCIACRSGFFFFFSFPLSPLKHVRGPQFPRAKVSVGSFLYIFDPPFVYPTAFSSSVWTGRHPTSTASCRASTRPAATRGPPSSWRPSGRSTGTRSSSRSPSSRSWGAGSYRGWPRGRRRCEQGRPDQTL